MLILVINVGSTSLKFKLFEMDGEQLLSSGRVEGIGQPHSIFEYKTPDTASQSGTHTFTGYLDGIDHLLKYLLDDSDALQSLDVLSAVGFKTVLAKNIMNAAVLDEDVLAAMDAMSPIAPTHNPPYIAAIRAFQQRLPRTPMIGLFEPAFHHSIPEFAWRYALPYEWAEKYGIRRYGFHGASHRYTAQRAAEILGRKDLRLITCHLGGSTSINATRGTTSIDNSFGLSPQSGVIHSGRPGDIDPIIPLWMIEELGLSTAEARKILSSESGIKALSGVSGEMREIINAAQQGDARAQMAIDAFVYKVRQWIGCAAVALGGIDALVFTGGIGERSALIRAKCCENLDFLGVHLRIQVNDTAKPDCDVATTGSPVRILIIEANEEIIVARACKQVLTG
ncbi:MAG: acetate/propionate family kinase [Candidatus Sumerlaeaceae bacterium]